MLWRGWRGPDLLGRGEQRHEEAEVRDEGQHDVAQELQEQIYIYINTHVNKWRYNKEWCATKARPYFGN